MPTFIETLPVKFPGTALAAIPPAGSSEEDIYHAAGTLALAYRRSRMLWKRGDYESMTSAIAASKVHLPYLPQWKKRKAIILATDTLHESHGRAHGMLKRDYRQRVVAILGQATMEGRAPHNTESRHLTPEQVRFIRAEHVPGHGSPTNGYQLAKLFEVTPAVVYALLEGRTYRHIE